MKLYHLDLLTSSGGYINIKWYYTNRKDNCTKYGYSQYYSPFACKKITKWM